MSNHVFAVLLPGVCGVVRGECPAGGDRVSRRGVVCAAEGERDIFVVEILTRSIKRSRLFMMGSSRALP